MKISILFLFLFFICFIDCAPLIKTPPSPVVWSEFLGINVQYEWWNETIVKKQISVMKDLGIKWVRASVHWAVLEATENNIKWEYLDTSMNLIKENGLKSIVTFVGTPNWASSYTNGSPNTDTYPPKDDSVFADRVLKLNSRYPFVDYWEIWNEQNLSPGFWRPYYNATRYDELYQNTATILRNAGLGSKLAVGGIGYYGISVDKDNNQVDMVADLKGLGTFKDSLVSYHPYTDLPEGGLSEGNYADNIYGHYETSIYVNKNIREGGSNQVWTTEWGWSSGTESDQVDRETQAKYTVRRLLIDSLVGFNKTFLFTISDLDARASSIRDQGYGIVDLNVNKKPVYDSLARLFNITGSSLESISATDMNSYLDKTKLGEDFVGVFYKKPSTNTTLFAFWSISTNISFNLKTNQTGKLYSISDSSNQFITPSNGAILLNLTSDVQIFEWPLLHSDNSKDDDDSSKDSDSLSFSNKLHFDLLFIFISIILLFFI
ncbi:hypothetical protein DICPUDRAFT_78906 [Dictyostelium purpureum]|uniref:Glycoside hydrolase family 5 domain-containing protein n=1 Tax=Dictyostelium purpureum TaxID=5786 RepID=F0ZKY8_DICPU|nr:uncharacterized protein DICPUDRAFT_78906 [Dictyostelium purpureum]EGC35400.1 hypothetical protein DICPUDRAFT_78906 [Dictyostelium purpureum]|eukprot:XP_003288076.1 hypothetical protein DICPUDRAFT_78906 [Dictyostelium purpureum]